jgi:hypothetical protein
MLLNLKLLWGLVLAGNDVQHPRTFQQGALLPGNGGGERGCACGWPDLEGGGVSRPPCSALVHQTRFLLC